METDIIKKARSYAYRLLNHRPRSEKEIRQKLYCKGFSKRVIDNILSDLKDKSFVDDNCFARLWMESRLQSSGQGFFKIKHELFQKGISEDIIENVTEQLKGSFDEYDIAAGLVQRRLAAIKGLDSDKARQRLYCYLKRRGFSGNTIQRVLDETH
jgi:regulatory protein